MSALAVTAAMLGLLGGAHCLGMCGGLISAVTLARPEGGLPAQIGYNLGRVASYACAGAIAGTAGSLGQVVGALIPAQTMLLVVANAVVILLGLSLAGQGSLAATLESAGGMIWRLVRRAGGGVLPGRESHFGALRALALGAVWGWVPCGLVYSALALALVSGDAMRGAGIMLAFGAGTLPSLMAAGLAAKRLRAMLARKGVRQLAGGIVAMLGVAGLARIPGLGERIMEGLFCVV